MDNMKADIINGVYVKVGGRAGQTNGLSWRILDNMFSHLQELIKLLAKYELETDISPTLKDFDIEIFDFRPGSAVPAFRLVPTIQASFDTTPQRVVVASQFDELMSYADKGNYELYFNKKSHIPEVQYDVAEELFGFILAAENSPLSIVRPLNGKGDFKELYQVPPFTKKQSEFLLKPKRRREKPQEPEEILGLIRRIGKKNRIIDIYDSKDAILSIAPIEIITDTTTYRLYSPLLCTVSKEDGNYIVENEMLDLYAAGSSLDEAEHDLYKEFDASYQLLDSLPDDELSDRLLRTKNMLKMYVSEIINITS